MLAELAIRASCCVYSDYRTENELAKRNAHQKTWTRDSRGSPASRLRRGRDGTILASTDIASGNTAAVGGP